MFPILRTEIESRFKLAEDVFKASRSLKGDVSQVAKGMIFVQVYAAYEYTVKSVVQSTVDGINSHGTKMEDLLPTILCIYLNPELMSIRDVGEKGIWDARLKLFDKAFSKSVATVNSVTPHDGSHYKYSALELIFRVFSITRLPVRRRSHISRINEVVNNRNQIAHGSERAEEVGRRYTREDILHIMRQMKSVCLLLHSIFEDYCVDPARHRRKT
ncbi:MAG TPA: MAE_28990/MAE_18760 family HEPN-like nuclease [Rhizomicrobium sp.]|nr:MAE_28990/MAE_18760 family HEPN-like nuclease [Rhizomicrobium sp.]